ncbi:hypothetical protein JMY81_18435 [Brenneria goodwinii]|uniref:hypothetical protein n=1 Tax=Brenneria goodwinii TaxID=1109412 RepID=UPI0016024E6B|nr:hypothetical protein [Brenneria goodwinii]MCG8154930.1 hypothetical protein [Brenneria goodwinii]MCG8162773.1 hypothetical protein [Brenneria goodwinii]MCG8164168.1 hypothetical protein [Brenneria goodwinii]MCG8168777.1 hypothetical protein [Brenneria goodwinii]MCG8173668.1 hypothetical protein [Brenneria goodwinii]
MSVDQDGGIDEKFKRESVKKITLFELSKIVTSTNNGSTRPGHHPEICYFSGWHIPPR